MNFWKKRIKTEADEIKLANDLNVDISKIKELKKGDREIKGDTLDSVLNAVAKSKAESEIKNVEIMQWYLNTDLRKLRKEFGYKTQMQLSILLHEQHASLNRFENHKYNKINRLITKMYYFYSNDFNKNLDNQQPIKADNEVIKWFKTTDLKKLRQQYYPQYDQQSFSKFIGIAKSTYGGYENKEGKLHKTTKGMIKLYDFWHNQIKEKVANEQKEIPINIDDDYVLLDDKNDINDTVIKQLITRNKELRKQIERYEKLIDMM